MSELGRVHQGLYLQQQHARPLPYHGDGTAGDIAVATGKKNRRRIAYLPQAAFGHGEKAELVGRAESVLDRADHPVTTVAFALEVEHRVNHVLQNPRPRNGAFLGNVADENNRRVPFLGELHQARGAVSDLRDASRCRLQRIGVHGLDGIDDHDRWTLPGCKSKNLLHVGFCQQS